jgi:hypothetical protein
MELLRVEKVEKRKKGIQFTDNTNKVDWPQCSYMYDARCIN